MLRRKAKGPGYYHMAEEQMDRWRTHVRTCKKRSTTRNSHGLYCSPRDSLAADDLDYFISEFGQVRILDNGLLKIKFEGYCENDGCVHSHYFSRLAKTADIEWMEPHEI